MDKNTKIKQITRELVVYESRAPLFNQKINIT